MGKAINKKVFSDFFNSTTSSGIILFSCLILSLIIANSPLGKGFNNFLATQIGYENSSVHLKYSVALWINDGLMAQEAKFSILVGSVISGFLGYLVLNYSCKKKKQIG